MKGTATSLLWDLRSRLSGAARQRIRQITDPLSGPLGSIRGARTRDLVVGLTFDDGPDPESTTGVLNTLAQHRALATFFVLIDRAEANPQLVRRMLAEGHEVGLHGLDHQRLTRLDRGEIAGHIANGFRRLTEISGRKPRWFRPPYGSQDLRSYVAARRSGMDVVVWSADCEDWVQRPVEEIARQAVDAARPGGVLLLHDALAFDSRERTFIPVLDRAAIVNQVLTGLAERGYRALSVSALLDGRRAHRTAWFRP
jgi:peptidoglycan/xylan/chitin deacetylase (PgdA/CDA1 family)